MFWAALVLPTVWLEKVKLAGLKLRTAPVPVPESETVCGLPGALSLIDSVPVRVPVAVGVKVTDIVQFAPAARDVVQAVVFAKSPVIVILMPVSGALPSEYRVTVCAGLVEPTV
jgi:hypothetical protein